jgi:hypothetical protein
VSAIGEGGSGLGVGNAVEEEKGGGLVWVAELDKSEARGLGGEGEEMTERVRQEAEGNAVAWARVGKRR